MAKNAPKTGKSAKRGNAPAPYTKYRKRPYKYAWTVRKVREERRDNA